MTSTDAAAPAGEDVAGEAAGVVAGEAAGVVAGEAAGVVAGEAAGVVAGEAAGVVAGEAAGVVAGEAAGVVAGEAAGVVAGEAAGVVAGEAAGVVAGEAAGVVAGEAAGVVAGEAAGVVAGEAAGVVAGEAAGVVAGEAAGVVARAVAAERLTFFADAVIAIAITLLALELPVPEGTTNRALLHAAAEHRDEYVAFLISFAVIGAHWSGHHRVFRWVETLGGRLVSLTLRWLLLLVVTPYATRVLNGEGAFETRFVFYASVQALTGVLFAVMVREVRRHGLHRPGMPRSIFGHAYLNGLSISAGFLVSIPLAFVTHYAYVCWIVVPALGRIAGLVRRVRPARGRAAPED